MIERSIARRYARALFSLGKEQKKLDAYLEQLRQLESTSKTSPLLLLSLGNRFLDMGERLAIVNEVASRCGFDKEVKNFIKILIEKARISLLSLIIEAYQGYVYADENKVEAVVTSAHSLGQDQINILETTFSSIMGKKVLLKGKVEPSVLGGVSVQIGGEIFDGTLRSQLNRLTQELKVENF
ncbi:MAG TPA: ATP synthase F1 subunit delta [Deltaproteobacteria bacterium]|nr:MAG: ATP synthase F1 subunit delta [Deltaproteobacteria bacterium GWA2_45_12]HBF11914.1 ATP synthase F1 subunit delta [Deltaproteobacteria bacterium]